MEIWNGKLNSKLFLILDFFLLNMNIKWEQVENSLIMFQKPLSMSSGTAGVFFVDWLFEWVNTKYLKGWSWKKLKKLESVETLSNL